MEMKQELSQDDRLERVRQAVIRAGSTVTVGDITSATGLGTFEAEESLKALLGTHEGTLKVSEHGELLFAFQKGVIERDYRSWWARSQEAIYRGFKLFFKIAIMLTLVFYFILYIVIILAMLTSNRNSSSSSFNMGGFIWFFWGGSGRHYESRDGRERVPLYTKVFQFVFGKEEPKLDPLQAQTDCGQLIRARNGVITAEDWMLVSGQSLEKCESDLARFTSIFDGEAEITSNGTLLYVFKDMMKSGQTRRQMPMPSTAWNRLQPRRALSNGDFGHNMAVIGLNSFNLVMSIFMTTGMVESLQTPEPPYEPSTVEHMVNAVDPQTFFWLGTFPLAFSFTLFAIPLMRLPANRRENAKRRAGNMRKLALKDVFTNTARMITVDRIESSVNTKLEGFYMRKANTEEVNHVLNEIAYELNAELKSTEGGVSYFAFDEMHARQAEASDARQQLNLKDQDLGRVIFSTDDSDDEARRNAEDVELEAFDARLGAGRTRDARQPGNARQPEDYSSSSRETKRSSSANP